jgi:hypothetical protein
MKSVKMTKTRAGQFRYSIIIGPTYFYRSIGLKKLSDLRYRATYGAHLIIDNLSDNAPRKIIRLAYRTVKNLYFLQFSFFKRKTIVSARLQDCHRSPAYNISSCKSLSSPTFQALGPWERTQGYKEHSRSPQL